jgi:hypothetical protein
MASGVLKSADKSYWTIEVIQGGPDKKALLPPGAWMVLYSVARQSRPSELTCRFGYSNAPKVCDVLTGRGFPFVEADIGVNADNKLTVTSPSFRKVEVQPEAGREIDYHCPVLTIRGFDMASAGGAPKDPFDRDYEQELQTPDLVMPADFLRKRPIGWSFRRSEVRRHRSRPTIKIARLSWPSTEGLEEELKAERFWTGMVEPPVTWRRATDADDSRRRYLSGHRPRSVRAERSTQFGPPQFRFKDVEVLGFRLELPTPADDEAERAQEKTFYRLIAPLNLHLPSSQEDPRARNTYARPDFHFRPAAKALNIELLRYGSMTPRQDFAGMAATDFQSQHELLVRVLVGREDEDCAQAQQPSTFVPAIFVDNPWSKFLGRMFLGMDKRLAHFCVEESGVFSRLLPNGRIAPRPSSEPLGATGKPPEPAVPPLARIARISLASNSSDLTDAHRLFEMDCEAELLSSWDDFRPAPTEAVLGASPLQPRRWRQEDFEDAEVRRDFARAAGQGSSGSFRAVQSVPIGEHELTRDVWGDEITWIAGRYNVVGSVMLARPAGVITITLHRGPQGSAEKIPLLGWERLCDLLDVPKGEGGRKEFSLPAGSWYRLRHDIDMELENGLE